MELEHLEQAIIMYKAAVVSWYKFQWIKQNFFSFFDSGNWWGT